MVPQDNYIDRFNSMSYRAVRKNLRKLGRDFLSSWTREIEGDWPCRCCQCCQIARFMGI